MRAHPSQRLQHSRGGCRGRPFLLTFHEGGGRCCPVPDKQITAQGPTHKLCVPLLPLQSAIAQLSAPSFAASQLHGRCLGDV